MKRKPRQMDTDDLFATTGEAAITNYELEITNDKNLTTTDSKLSNSSISNSQFVISNSCRRKPSGIPWLGDIPEHWNSASLKWISRRYSGGTPDKTNEAYWTDGTIPWLNSGSVNDRFIKEPSEYITEDAFSNSSAKWIKKGSLVIALAGQGKTKGMVAQLDIDSTCNQSMAAICPRNDLEPRFLYWWLRNNYINIRNLAGGDLRDGLNLEMIGSIPTPLPPLPEQKAIAEYLDRKTGRIDSLISKKEKLVELLKEKRSALISHTVTKGLPAAEATKAGLNSKVKFKPSGINWLGDIPEHWEARKLSHGFTNIGSGTTPPSDQQEWYDGDIPWITTGELRENYITETEKKVTNEAIKNFSALKLFPKGSLSIAMYGATIGRLGILGVDATTNQACCVLYGGSSFDIKFTFYCLQAFKETIILLASGGGQPNISQDKIKSLIISCPPISEQKVIAEYLDRETGKIDSLISRVESAIGKLKEYRSAVISAAVTGKRISSI